MVTHVLVELLPEGVACGGAATEQLQGALGQSHGPHAVMQPPRAQTALGDLEAPPLPWRHTHTVILWQPGSVSDAPLPNQPKFNLA